MGVKFQSAISLRSPSVPLCSSLNANIFNLIHIRTPTSPPSIRQTIIKNNIYEPLTYIYGPIQFIKKRRKGRKKSRWFTGWEKVLCRVTMSSLEKFSYVNASWHYVFPELTLSLHICGNYALPDNRKLFDCENRFKWKTLINHFPKPSSRTFLSHCLAKWHIVSASLYCLIYINSLHNRLPLQQSSF